MTEVLLSLSDVHAYELQQPYLDKYSRYATATWDEWSHKWTGTLRIVSGNACREVRLDNSHSGELYGSCRIPSHAVDLSVLDSQEQFVLEFVNGGEVMYLGLEFNTSCDARKFYRALLCQEGEGDNGANAEMGEGHNGTNGEMGEGTSGSGRCLGVEIGKDREGISQEEIKLYKELLDKVLTHYKVKEIMAENSRLNETLKMKEHESKELSTSNSLLKKSLEVKEAELIELGESNLRLKKSFEMKEAELIELGESNSHLKKSFEVKEAELIELGESNLRLKNLLKANEKAYKNLNSRLLDLQRENAMLVEKSKAQDRKIQVMQIAHCDAIVKVLTESRQAVNSISGCVDSVQTATRKYQEELNEQIGQWTNKKKKLAP